MSSRALAACLGLSFGCCASDVAPTSAGIDGLSAQAGDPAAGSACGPPSWRTLRGPSLGHGDAPARRQASDAELELTVSPGFEVGRSSEVYSSRGNQLIVEIENLEPRWRCGIRAYPMARGANGAATAPLSLGESGQTILGANGADIDRGEEIRGSCLGPNDVGYLPLPITDEVATITLRLEALGDGRRFGPPPTCLVPESYTYSAGNLSIQARHAGTVDPSYQSSSGSELASVLVMDDEGFPVAMFSLGRDTSDAPDSSRATFSGVVGFSRGLSQSLSVLIW